MNHPLSTLGVAVALLSLIGSAVAGSVKDRHGNVGYDTAAECDAAVRSGSVKFYESFTTKPPLVRPGEARVKAMTLGDVAIPQGVAQGQSFGATGYAAGACDLGAGASGGRDGVGKELQGRYVPYSAAMPVNVYYDKANNPVRVSMKQCDNWFSSRFPRPVAAAVVQRAAPAPAPAAVDPAPAPAPAPAAVAAPPAPKPAPVAAPVAPKPAPMPAVAAAKGGISTGAAIGIGAALIAVPLLLGNHGDDNGASGTTGTTGTR